MARYVKHPPFTGTRGYLTIYKLGERHYVRTKSSLSGKRVKKDPAFRRTMENAGILAQASRIASGVYREVPPEKKAHQLYRIITGQAMRMLKEGLAATDVHHQLIQLYVSNIPAAQAILYVNKEGQLRSQALPVWSDRTTISRPATGHLLRCYGFAGINNVLPGP